MVALGAALHHAGFSKMITTCSRSPWGPETDNVCEHAPPLILQAAISVGSPGGSGCRLQCVQLLFSEFEDATHLHGPKDASATLGQKCSDVSSSVCCTPDIPSMCCAVCMKSAA